MYLCIRCQWVDRNLWHIHVSVNVHKFIKNKHKILSKKALTYLQFVNNTSCGSIPWYIIEYITWYIIFTSILHTQLNSAMIFNLVYILHLLLYFAEFLVEKTRGDVPGRLADGAVSKVHLHQIGPTLSTTHIIHMLLYIVTNLRWKNIITRPRPILSHNCHAPGGQLCDRSPWKRSTCSSWFWVTSLVAFLTGKWPPIDGC